MHKHNWVKIKETYAAPNDNVTSMHGTGSDIVNDMLKLKMGLTTVLWECSICQRIRKEEMLGK